MSDLLTQDEIDALLSGLDESHLVEELEEEAAVVDLQQHDQIRKYDFSSRDRIICTRMPVLDTVNERFSRLFRTSLSRFLGFSVDIESSGIQVQQFSEYIQGLQNQTSLTIAKFSPLRGRALISMDPNLVFAVVDHYFGGAGQLKNPVENKQTSLIVLRVIRLVLDMVFNDLKEAWKPVMELDFDNLGTEVSPKFANIADPAEIVVISTIHIQMKGGKGDLNITMPYSMIEANKALFDVAGSESPEEDYEWQTAFRQQILRAKLNVASLLTEKKLTISDVMRLKKGDVILIDTPETVVLSVHGIPLFKGKSGVSGGHYAVQVINKISS